MKYVLFFLFTALYFLPAMGQEDLAFVVRPKYDIKLRPDTATLFYLRTTAFVVSGVPAGARVLAILDRGYTMYFDSTLYLTPVRRADSMRRDTMPWYDTAGLSLKVVSAAGKTLKIISHPFLILNTPGSSQPNQNAPVGIYWYQSTPLDNSKQQTLSNWNMVYFSKYKFNYRDSSLTNPAMRAYESLDVQIGEGRHKKAPTGDNRDTSEMDGLKVRTFHSTDNHITEEMKAAFKKMRKGIVIISLNRKNSSGQAVMDILIYKIVRQPLTWKQIKYSLSRHDQ